jgi:hypothetical protein
LEFPKNEIARPLKATNSPDEFDIELENLCLSLGAKINHRLKL